MTQPPNNNSNGTATDAEREKLAQVIDHLYNYDRAVFQSGGCIKAAGIILSLGFRLARVKSDDKSLDKLISDLVYEVSEDVTEELYEMSDRTKVARKALQDFCAARLPASPPSPTPAALIQARAQGVEEAFIGVLASLVAAVSILQRADDRKKPPSKVVGSDAMFVQMLSDYEKAISTGRAAIPRPVEPESE